MENNVQMWSEKTKAIFSGVLIYSVAKVVYAIFDPINNLSSAAGAMSSLLGGGSNSSSIGFLDILCYLALAGIIGGYYLFLKGLGEFRALLAPADSLAINRIRNGIIIGLVATAVDFIPLLGWVEGILNIIAFVLMLLGYSALKKSTTFPSEATKGAARLYMSMILALIGAILGFIPLAGGFIEMVFVIIVFFMTLSGWNMIKNATPVQLEQD